MTDAITGPMPAAPTTRDPVAPDPGTPAPLYCLCGDTGAPYLPTAPA